MHAGQREGRGGGQREGEEEYGCVDELVRGARELWRDSRAPANTDRVKLLTALLTALLTYFTALLTALRSAVLQHCGCTGCVYLAGAQ